MSLRQRPISRSIPASALVLPSKKDDEFDYSKIHPAPKPRIPKWQNERIILAALTVAALFTRFFRLAQPAAVVFDESHFGMFMQRHLRREFSFDIHPWLGKLTIALFAWLERYRDVGFEFEIPMPYHNNDYYLCRVVAALFGSGCIPLMYLICRELQISVPVSILGATLPLFDHMLAIESRLILIDAQLIFYLKLTLLCAFRLWNSVGEGKQGTTKYFGYLVATAMSCAAAMSVKWTAAATPFLIAIVCGLGVWFLSRPTPLMHCAIAAVVGLTIYTIPWYIHLKISTTSTEMAVVMGDRFRSTLHGNATFPYNPEHNVTFAESLYELHWRQFRANQKVKTRHRWESKWYHWPLNLRGIMYFADKAVSHTEEHPVLRIIYLIQNPAGSLLVFISVASFSVLMPIVHRYRHEIPKDHQVHDIYCRGSFLLAGYLLNLLPYMLVERCYFTYHYLPALTYGQLLSSLLINSLPKAPRKALSVLILCTLVAAFIYWAPMMYALPLDYDAIGRRQWLHKWK